MTEPWQEMLSDEQRRLFNAACGDLSRCMTWHGFRLSKDDWRHFIAGTILGWRMLPGIDAEITEWMQFMIAKKKDRAHVFQRDPNKKSVLYSLCLRWQVRKIRNTGLSALEKANQDRPHCKLCEKRLKEIHNG